MFNVFGSVVALNQVDAQTAIVCFRPGVVGNALVLGNNSASKTQWSWHFWVLDDIPGSFGSNGFEVMDRNLGASNPDPASVDVRGLNTNGDEKIRFQGQGIFSRIL